MAICCDKCKKLERDGSWEKKINMKFEENAGVYEAIFCSWNCAENFCVKERWKKEGLYYD